MIPEYMIPIYNARRENLMAFLEAFETQEALAEVCDLDPAYVSAVINKRRNMGDKVARKVELNLELLIGSLDRREKWPQDA